MPGNRICWNVISQLDSLSDVEKQRLKNAEWSSESNEAMIAEVKDFLIPLGGTLGDLIEATPRDNISRVYLEDKMFETWNHGRIALIGDGKSIDYTRVPGAGEGGCLFCCFIR